MSNVIDINKILGTVGFSEDTETSFFLSCPFCEKTEFVPLMKQVDDSYEIKDLICVSKDCEGDSFIRIKDGKTDGMFDHLDFTDFLDDI